jgi:hypothetical protein
MSSVSPIFATSNVQGKCQHRNMKKARQGTGAMIVQRYDRTILGSFSLMYAAEKGTQSVVCRQRKRDTRLRCRGYDDRRNQ